MGLFSCLRLGSASPLKWAAILGVITALLIGSQPAAANHLPYVVGDVFAGIGQGKINRYSPTGVLIEQLNTTGNSNEQTGMCFGENGNLRSTNFTNNNMTLFNNQGGVIAHPWGGPFNTHPESCVLDAAGNIYVGQADGSQDVLKFNASGTLLATYNVQTGPRGSDWIDLASDQCTLFYTSEGNLIRRYDVCTSTQLANFATLPSSPCFALRIRTNGEVMVACSNFVYRLSPAGVVVQSYPKPATEASTFLFAMNLDPDNATFWTAGYSTGHIFRYDITTGAVVFTFNAPANPTLAGLAVFGEITAARPPANLTLTPKADTNPVGTQHCVTATVTDAQGGPSEGVVVRFSVTGAVNTSGSATTDEDGEATFCYNGPTSPGVDAIHAYADTDNDGTEDTGEPSDNAAKIWVAGDPVKLTLSPKADANPVDSQHCVTATVTDAFNNPTPNIVVRFSVTGSVNTSGSATTNASGQATFCYTGPPLPGADAISAYADTNNDNTQDPGEPSDVAAKTWVLPTSTPLCEIKITNGGWIIANNLDKASFGGNAKSDGEGDTSGNEEYQDHGPAQPLNLHGDVLAVVCDTPTSATIYGTATIDGAGSFFYRIKVEDNAEPGKGADKYWMLISNGYDSGNKVLKGGNVQIHLG